MSEAQYIRDLEGQVAALTAENTKLREWKSRVIETFNSNYCGKCEEFLDSDDAFCFVCQKYHCQQCWEGRHETLRRPDATGSVIDTFDVCHDCAPPTCGTCGGAGVKIFCPMIQCTRSFCSEKCYDAHYDAFTAAFNAKSK